MNKIKIALVLTVILFATTSVQASSSFFEGFNLPLNFKQPGDPQTPGLWLINDGDFHDGSYQYYTNCGDSSCMTSRHEAGTPWFLRTSMFHDQTPGNYVNMEASELQTGYAYGKGYEDTHPSFGHPVVLKARMRCSTCNTDGSGGQVGSWGLWMWNSYPEVQEDGSFLLNPVTSLGFSWAQQGGVFPAGLTMNVFRNNVPLFLQPVVVPGLDLKQWHTYSVVWTEGAQGKEHVVYKIDEQTVGERSLVLNMPALSETIWHDNQVVTGIDPNGNFTVTFENPTNTQNLDVDYITVLK